MSRGKSIAVKDHKGNVYPSLYAMAKAYGVNYYTLKSRVSKGIAIEECLKTVDRYEDSKRGRQSSQEWKDHKGNTYRTKAELCRAYGISPTLYDSRKGLGWSLEDVLTKPTRKWGGHNHKIKNDSPEEQYSAGIETAVTSKKKPKHDDVTADDILKLVNSVGNVSTEAKSTDVISEGTGKNYVVDPYGTKYDTVEQMCEGYGVKLSTYEAYRKAGKSMTEALCLSGEGLEERIQKQRMNLCFDVGSIIGLNSLNESVYECTVRLTGKRVYLTAYEIMTYGNTDIKQAVLWVKRVAKAQDPV